MKIWIPALVTLLLSGQSSGQECASDGSCDTHERCPVWRDEGECYRNESYMNKHCPVSCMNADRQSTRKDCKDAHPRCHVWAELGECDETRDMKKYCAKSCNSCLTAANVEDVFCTDGHENCANWADLGECENNPGYMLKNCAKSCGQCPKRTRRSAKKEKLSARKLHHDNLLAQTANFGDVQKADGSDSHETLAVVESSIEYMQSDDVRTLTKEYRDLCRNNHELCSFWAAIGECEVNKSFMKIQCAPACRSCHLIDMSQRCPKLEDAVPGLVPGGLNKMFERIVATAPGNTTLSDDNRRKLAEEGMPEYSVVVHSRPSDGPATEISKYNDMKLPPWVITLENIITEEECDEMIKLGYEEGYKRSEDVGQQKLDGTVDSHKSKGRTSENAWCSSRNGCRQKEVPVRLHNRMSKVMGIPPENSEDLQILKYGVGQFYNTHHDYIPHQKDRQCGPRILTFFIYLSDVEAGGGTDFPNLGLTIMPKKGRAVLWPSVYDYDPLISDDRTKHQALEVEKGTKFAANGWIHMYDYEGPQERGCN